jgi:hypothetical protein
MRRFAASNSKYPGKPGFQSEETTISMMQEKLCAIINK